MAGFLSRLIFKSGWPIILTGLLVLFVTACQQGTGSDNSLEENGEKPVLEQVILNGHAVMMELALTPDQRARGLMGREALADDEGMLFVYPDRDPYPAEVSFWMKDCLIPIDVIFISREGKIVSIHEMEPPAPGTPDEDLPAYPSGGPVQFAIELRGGLAGELGLETGRLIDLRADYLIQMAE